MDEGKNETDNTPIGVLQALVADLEAENDRLRDEVERLRELMAIGAAESCGCLDCWVKG